MRRKGWCIVWTQDGYNDAFISLGEVFWTSICIVTSSLGLLCLFPRYRVIIERHVFFVSPVSQTRCMIFHHEDSLVLIHFTFYLSCRSDSLSDFKA